MSTSSNRLQDAPVLPEEGGIAENAPLALQGEGAAIRQIRKQLARIGPYFRRALLIGEVGVGKESTARFLHGLSPVALGPFITSSAAALAQSATPIDAARRGTLFIEDIGSLPLSAQDSLMRRLATLDQKVRARLVETRLVGASNCDLKALTLTGHFRQDLYNCLSVVELRLPPLRERGEDIDDLIRFCIRQSSEAVLQLSPETREILVGHTWSGNLRELQQVVETAVAAASAEGSEEIDPGHLPPLSCAPDLPPETSDSAAVASLNDVMRRHVIEVLARCAGNKLKAAELLGISRSTLYRMLDGG